MSLRMILPALIIFVLVVASLYPLFTSTKKDEAMKEEIGIRQIGHEFLLHSGDSTSRVLPVRKMSNNEYRLEFENSLSFLPDSLVDIMVRTMKTKRLSNEYIVTVVDLATQENVYGFNISSGDETAVPCFGRRLPAKNYAINIFLAGSAPVYAGTTKALLLACIVVLLIFGGNALWLQLRRRANSPAVVPAANLVARAIWIGKYLFYPDKYLLVYNDHLISLTQKEAKLLSIFTKDLNQVIERSRLLREGWEEEGVITQRSLDMYVSRLRKKLKSDPSVNIANIHGRGYCLKTEVSPLIVK